MLFRSEKSGVRAFLVNDRGDVDAGWLESVDTVVVTAGASAPEHLVEELVEFLAGHGFGRLEEVGLVEEDVRFSLPPELGRGLTAITRS